MARGMSAPGAGPPPVAGAPVGVPVTVEEADGDALADVLAPDDSLVLGEGELESEAEAEADGEAEEEVLAEDD